MINIEIDKSILDAVDAFEKALRNPNLDDAKVYNDAKSTLLAKLLSRIQIEREIRAAIERMEG